MEHTTRSDIHGTSQIGWRDPGDCVGPSCTFDPRAAATSRATPRHAHHDHFHDVSKRRLLIVLGITAVFMVVELVGGLIANSLALMADAAHMLTDVAALGLSLFVLWFSRRPARPEKSFGYLRLEILAALVNGVALVAISAAIFWQAYQRLRAPQQVEGGIMLLVAAAGLLVNIGAAWLLHGSAQHSLNLRGAYLHVIGDLVGSVGAIAAAAVILTTGYTFADPVISVIVALLILFSSWKIVREAVDVLLESTPAHIDLSAVRKAIDEIPGVDDVHDLHVWTLTSGYLAMSGHAVVRQPDQNQRILQEIHRSMRDNFGISHVTVQLECPAA